LVVPQILIPDFKQPVERNVDHLVIHQLLLVVLCPDPKITM
jgi:hypothetical protein